MLGVKFPVQSARREEVHLRSRLHPFYQLKPLYLIYVGRSKNKGNNN